MTELLLNLVFPESSFLFVYGTLQPGETSRKPQPYTDKELTHLITLLEKSDETLVFLFLAATGMRRGEALAVRWCDINITETTAEVFVDKQVKEARTYAHDGTYTVTRIITQPKTANSKCSSFSPRFDVVHRC